MPLTPHAPVEENARRSDHAPTQEFYRPNSYRPEDSIAHLMRLFLMASAAAIEDKMAPLALTHAQWMPLLKLHRRPAQTAVELARDCHMDAGGMTRMLDRLVDKGFVQRTRSSQDRRVVHIELTPRGQATAAHIPAVVCEVQNAAMRGFSQTEFETLQALLRRMLDNARQMRATGSEEGYTA